MPVQGPLGSKCTCRPAAQEPNVRLVLFSARGARSLAGSRSNRLALAARLRRRRAGRARWNSAGTKARRKGAGSGGLRHQPARAARRSTSFKCNASRSQFAATAFQRRNSSYCTRRCPLPARTGRRRRRLFFPLGAAFVRLASRPLRPIPAFLSRSLALPRRRPPPADPNRPPAKKPRSLASPPRLCLEAAASPEGHRNKQIIMHRGDI